MGLMEERNLARFEFNTSIISRISIIFVFGSHVNQYTPATCIDALFAFDCKTAPWIVLIRLSHLLQGIDSHAS